jgi:hypothetical protein
LLTVEMPSYHTCAIRKGDSAAPDFLANLSEVLAAWAAKQPLAWQCTHKSGPMPAALKKRPHRHQMTRPKPEVAATTDIEPFRYRPSCGCSLWLTEQWLFVLRRIFASNLIDLLLCPFFWRNAGRATGFTKKAI